MISDERQTRVADYLDDKLQTFGDLDSLDSLLSNIRNQHGLLKKQLEDAERDLQGAKEASRGHHASLQQRAHQFDREQNDIDRRLQVITASETSDEAVQRFEASMDKLQRLDVANGYMQLLKEVDVLSKEAQSQLKKSSEAALGPYKQLQSLASRMIPLQDAAEGAAPHLLDHIVKTTQTLRRRIKDAFSADLDAVLKKIKWPTPKAILAGNVQEEWNAAVGKLLDLQVPELEAMESNAKNKEPLVLFPLEVLAEPLEMRFRYHFEGDKPTNRLDKPEYFFSHITGLLNDYSRFIDANLQPILLNQFRGTDLALNPICIDATSALITALLPMLRKKVFSILPQVASQPQLLSHLMHEVMSFDTTIRDEWRYDGGYGIEGWKGIAWEILVQKDYFGRWLQVEKDFALARYESIIDAPDFGDLDYESVDPKATKPTKGAIRVNDLLETITDRYRPLSSFSQKLRFLIDIQISIFDQLHGKFWSSLEAYLTKISSLGRTVHGISREEQVKLQGVEGLERLCRVYGSADYLEKAMRDWSDDVFFLELWEELQDRARSVAGKGIGPMSIQDVAERTSSAVGSDGDGGALFDETAATYSSLRIRTEGIIIDVLTNNVREALRPYRHINPWATLTNPPTTSTTAELDPLLTHLSSTLSFLSKALAPAPLRRIARTILLTISNIIWDNVLTRHTFSTAGAAQLTTDLAAICSVVDSNIGKGVAETGLRKCLEGARLVGLPVKGKSKNKTAVQEGAEDEDWGAWDDGEGMDADEEGRRGGRDGGDTALGLWDVEKRLFADNQSARDVLDMLGVEVLTETEARAVLRKRVELGS